MHKTTVGKYLVARLEEIGLQHIFGVPGDYVLSFFDHLEKSKIDVVCTCNELNAGYAADAYARIKGIGATCVTYGVGGLSLVNTVAGAYAEVVPMIVISGGPKLADRASKKLIHHTIGDPNLQHKVFDQVTTAAVILDDPSEAPEQIDKAIFNCLKFKMPVYIEIPVDVVNLPCDAPAIKLLAEFPFVGNKDVLAESIEETISLLNAAKNPVILAGVEIHRFNLQKELLQLVELTGYPFATTPLGKAALPEKHPQFIGVYAGKLFDESTQKIVEQADVVLALGAIATDLNLGQGTRFELTLGTIASLLRTVRIKNHIYKDVPLNEYIDGLLKQTYSKRLNKKDLAHPSAKLAKKFVPELNNKISIARFYERINHYIGKDHFIVADTGDSIMNALNLYLPEGIDFISQAFYLSIGYATPASLGVKLAAPDKRPIVFVGDGAFQMTAQAISTLIRNHANPIIFLMNNDGYTIERYLDDGSYNDLQMWEYYKLPEIFRGDRGYIVETEGDLENVLQKIDEQKDKLILVEVRLDRWDCSQALKNIGEAFKQKSKKNKEE